jgi:ankyrin repeat protein
LYIAAKHGHHHIVSALCSAGGDPGIFREDNKNTPLMVAAHHGHLETIKVLFAAGAML